MKFNHLNVPEHWQHYWTRYPEGYTILEALISWVSQVDDMIDNQNTLNENVEQFRKEIDEFVAGFDERLQDEVITTLTDWQNSGFLDVVIAEAVQWELDEFRKQVEDLIKYPVGVGKRFETIKSAYLQWIEDGKPLATILIYEGTYSEYINAGGHVNNNRLLFKGVDKNLVTWKYEHGGYDYAPFTGGGNFSFEGLTIIADHPEGWGSTTGGAYALHIDYPGAQGKVYIEDCDLISYQDSALGSGTSYNQELHLKNLRLFHYAEKDVSGSTGVNHGAWLYHTSNTPNATGQKVSADNVYAWSKNGPSIQLLSSGGGTVPVEITCINVTARSDFYETFTGSVYEALVTVSNPNELIQFSKHNRGNNSYKLNGGYNSNKDIIRFTRQLSEVGTQVISFNGVREIDSIECLMVLDGKKGYSKGYYVNGFHQSVYADDTNGNYYNTQSALGSICSGGITVRTYMKITSIEPGKINLEWGHTGGGATGEASATFIVTYKTSR